MAKEQTTTKQVAGYRFLTRIARGGVGMIWKVISRDRKVTRAVKVLHTNLLSSKDALREFELEYSLGKEFSHKSLLKYYEYGMLGKTQTVPYILMEYFPSQTLKEFSVSEDGKPLRKHADDIIERVARALSYVQKQGIVHRDIKPDNILVNESGEVRLIDFSVALKIGGGLWSRLIRTKTKAAGTPSYMAPEQIRNEKLTMASDVYSLGATLYEMLTGRPPFIAESQNELLNMHLKKPPPVMSRYNKDISMSMDTLVASMLAKSPQDRPADAETFLSRFRKESVFTRSASERISDMFED